MQASMAIAKAVKEGEAAAMVRVKDWMLQNNISVPEGAVDLGGLLNAIWQHGKDEGWDTASGVDY